MAPRPRNAGSKDLPPNLYRKTDSRNGVTYYTYKDPISGRCFGLGKDKDSAIREAVAANFADSVKPSLAERISEKPAQKQRTFSEWLMEYRELYAERNLSQTTNKSTRTRLDRLEVAFGSMPIRGIETMAIANYLTAMTKEGKAQMAKAMRSLLRDVFFEAMARGWVASNPVDLTKPPKVKVKRERLSLELWQAIYTEAKQPWLRNAMQLALLTGQRREDIAEMLFKDVQDGFLHVVQSKTGTRIRISTKLRLEVVGLELGEVIKRCRGMSLSRNLVHHTRNNGNAKVGHPLLLDTLSSAFSQARDRAALKLGITFGSHPPSFHEQRSLSARLHEQEGRSAQMLLGHKSSTMTDVYRDARGSEWIEVAAV